jgi:hypothetical protein
MYCTSRFLGACLRGRGALADAAAAAAAAVAAFASDALFQWLRLDLKSKKKTHRQSFF